MITNWLIRFSGFLVTVVTIVMIVAITSETNLNIGHVASCVMFTFLGGCGVWLMFNAHQV